MAGSICCFTFLMRSIADIAKLTLISPNFFQGGAMDAQIGWGSLAKLMEIARKCMTIASRRCSRCWSKPARIIRALRSGGESL